MQPETDRVTMWGELRSWPWYVQAGAAVLAAALIGAVFAIGPLTAAEFPDRSEWPEGAIPDRVAVADPAETPEAEPLEGVAPYPDAPLWTAEVEDRFDQVAHVDEGTLYLGRDSLRLERDGLTAWSHEWEDADAEVGVAGEVVIVAERLHDIGDDDYEWPGRRDTVALDLATGAELWRDREAGFVTVFADAVLMTECTGKQEDNVGDCTLHARDPRDRAPRWSTPTYASAQVLSASPWTGVPLPDRLLIRSYPTGHASRTVTVLEHGRTLHSVATQDAVLLAGDTLVVYDDYDDNPADGCAATFAGYRFGESAPAWEFEADTRKSADLAYCDDLPNTQARDGELPLTIDGTPSIVDVATGAITWEAPGAGQAIGIGPDTLVTAAWETDERGAAELVAYDTATGTERWRAHAYFDFGADARTVDATLWLYNTGSWGWETSGVHAYDLASGAAFGLPGVFHHFGPGQIVTIPEGDSLTLSAWPSSLW